MSRAYRISVSESIERIVHVEDGVCSTLELLPVLPAERMSEILAAELARRGFRREVRADGAEGVVLVREEDGGILVEVDPATGKVTARVTAQADVHVSDTRSMAVAQARQEADRARLAERVRGDLEKRVASAEEDLRREASARLERKLRDLAQELDQAVSRVTASALKEKAAQLGEIEELAEDPNTGAVTIKVKL